VSPIADPNAADQDAAWNGAMGERWLAHHQQLDRFLEPLGHAVIEALGSVDGSRVLDIGCGTGETTEHLARVVGTAGEAVGVDISQLLVKAALRRPGRQAEYLVADAGADQLGDPFDICHSRFGTMFFTDPPVAFAHLRSSMASDGRLGMVVWQPPTENEWVQLPLDIARHYLELPPPAEGPGPFSMGDPAKSRQLLEMAGFVEVEVQELRRTLSIGSDPLTTAQFLLAVLPTGPLVDQLEPADALKLTERLGSEVPCRAGVAELESAAWLVTARSR
jgi:SAM-dependent methyltransferase